MARHPALSRVRVDTLMLDTTYAAPRHTLPPQEQALSALADALERELAAQPASLVLVAAYRIGKERAFLYLARRLGTRVYCSPAKQRLLRLLRLPEADLDLLTSNPWEARVHVSDWGVAADGLEGYLDRLRGQSPQGAAVAGSGAAACGGEGGDGASAGAGGVDGGPGPSGGPLVGVDEAACGGDGVGRLWEATACSPGAEQLDGTGGAEAGGGGGDGGGAGAGLAGGQATAAPAYEQVIGVRATGGCACGMGVTCGEQQSIVLPVLVGLEAAFRRLAEAVTEYWLAQVALPLPVQAARPFQSVRMRACPPVPSLVST